MLKVFLEGKCSPQFGFVYSKALTDIERVSDHCSNVASCVIDTTKHNLNVHKSLHDIRYGSAQFDETFQKYSEKYSLSN